MITRHFLLLPRVTGSILYQTFRINMSGFRNTEKVMSGTSSIENHFSLRLLKFYMKVVGMWPVENTREKLISDLALLSFTAIISIGFMLQGIDFCYSIGNLQALTFNLPSTVSTLLECLKLSKFIMNRSEVMDFHTFIEKNFWKVRYNRDEYQILDMCNRKSLRLVIAHCIITQVLICFLVIIPIAESSAMNVTARMLPVKVYLDLPLTESPYYEIIFIFQSIVGVGVGLSITISAGYLSTTNFYAAGQFKILQRRLEFAFHDVASDGVDDPLIKMKVNPNFSNVRDCIKQHQLLIHYMQRMENFFSLILFIETLGSVLFLCFSGFQLVLSDVRTSLFRFLFGVQFLMIVLVNFFLFAWPCEEIIEESRKVAEAAYGSLWYSLPYTKEGRLCRQSMMIVIMRARNPCILTVGKFTPMSLQTYGSVVRTALSYFTVLRQMNEDNEA